MINDVSRYVNKTISDLAINPGFLSLNIFGPYIRFLGMDFGDYDITDADCSTIIDRVTSSSRITIDYDGRLIPKA